MKYLLLLTFCALAGQALPGQSYRYVRTVFPGASVTTNVRYASADFIDFPYFNESSTTRGDLFMDVYTPVGDLNTNRPAIIFAHSGGFLNGNRNHDDIVALCDSFARKGYVTATIDYRLGFNLLSDADLHGTRAVYRGLQDGRAAVRFLRANAAAYGIDPNKVYFGGSSAGSFIALHSIYMEDPTEKPPFADPVVYSNLVPPFTYTGPDLGGYDVGDHLSESGTPDAIMALWGAVESTDLITPANGQPALLVHGSDDETVPFGLGNPFGLSSLPAVEGSLLISGKLSSLGFAEHETYFVEGVGHEFHGTSNGTWDNGSGNTYWDTIINRAEQFFWKRHKPTADFTVGTNGLDAQFTFTGSGAISWNWDFGDGSTAAAANPAHRYSQSGNYSVFLYVENDNLSWDTIRQSVSVSSSLPVTWARPLRVERRAEGGNQLFWTVSHQENCASFTVEHARSEEDFIDLETIAGDGYLREARDFAVVHPKVGSGTHYYRIRQQDHDGSTSYSNTAVIRIRSANVQVTPNPSSGWINLSLPEDGGGEFVVSNAWGAHILTGKISGGTGQIDLSGLSAGLYFLRMKGSAVATKVVLE
ncbi:PKD domain-containing protein [Lewinella sp. W8]|uniref:PKD domain-containing protein n=1 Tax=Lewinella sp. W8 TaxID=2528208 RepID=UPI001068A42C|nr:PKD domain-containing protein [Lewinella sp. W8]MTB51199.1 carboxylesterase family protein [Lewinella sp. W8]